MCLSGFEWLWNILHGKVRYAQSLDKPGSKEFYFNIAPTPEHLTEIFIPAQGNFQTFKNKKANARGFALRVGWVLLELTYALFQAFFWAGEHFIHRQRWLRTQWLSPFNFLFLNNTPHLPYIWMLKCLTADRWRPSLLRTTRKQRQENKGKRKHLACFTQSFANVANWPPSVLYDKSCRREEKCCLILHPVWSCLQKTGNSFQSETQWLATLG